MNAERKEECIIENDALKQLYQKYSKEIYLYLYTMCKSPQLAEDLLQDTFLKALLSLSESHTNMRAWLYTVARNLYLNQRKREKDTVCWDDLQFREDMASSDLLPRIIQKEQTKQLFRAMNRLSDSKREVLQLQYFGGLSQNEIAAVLRLTPANVRVLALRAKRELKQYLEVEDYDLS